ncbi:PERF protein, partial [Amia calva]|nr:PERF protein [Amia calva]
KVGLGLVGVSGFYMAGTHSKSARFAMEKSRSDQYSLVSQDVHCKYYSFRLKDKPPLNSEFFKILSDSTNPCLFKCHRQTGIDADCCPSKPGLAKQVVIVERATGLWGDYNSKTEAYVKFFYRKQREETPVIWGRQIRFDTVELSMSQPVKFEMWDQDNRWNDDLLGK